MAGKCSSVPMGLQLLRLRRKNLETILKLRGWISQLHIIQDQLQQQVTDTINTSQHLESIEKTIKTWEPKEPKEETPDEWPAGTHEADTGELQVVYELIMCPPTASLNKVHRRGKGK